MKLRAPTSCHLLGACQTQVEAPVGAKTIDPALLIREEPMKLINLSTNLAKAALLSGLLLTFAPGVVLGAEKAKKGSTSYTTHFVFHPKSSIDIPGVGKATALEAVGPTENTKGQAMFEAVSIESGGKKWIDGACTLTDSDGDVVFSTFDTRDLDKSQPKMDCGTHTITGGTGKYKGITGKEPFACISKSTPAGEPEGSFAIDIPHNTTWKIKG
jgi:hypothetical protein